MLRSGYLKEKRLISMKEIVKTMDLTKRYGDLCPVNHLDLSVKEGKIYGFLGPNGGRKVHNTENASGTGSPDSR